MKKTLLLIGCFAAFSMAISAQPDVPNGDFESWSGGSPNDWSNSNILATGSVTQVVGQTGNGCQGAVSQSNFGTDMVPPYINTLVDGTTPYFEVDGEYPTLMFDYKFTAVQGDFMIASVSVMDAGGSTIGAGAATLSPSNVFTDGAVGIQYFGSGAARMSITFSIGHDSGEVHDGSEFIIDNVELSNTVLNVGEAVSNVDFGISSIYPNPANDFSTISYTLPTPQAVNVELYDLSGRKVFAESLNSGQGEQSYRLDLRSVPTGLYLIQLRTLNEVVTERIRIAK